jgi:hypothetical protein
MKLVPPNRVTRGFAQRLVARTYAVFPWLCLVREAGWINHYLRHGIALPGEAG